MNNDFGPDSGLFLRSTEDGTAYQAMIDYHPNGNLMGVYGEGRLGGKPAVLNFTFTDKVTVIIDRTNSPVPLPVLVESWPLFWRHGQWNELRGRIVNHPPTITTWVNGVKFMQWTERLHSTIRPLPEPPAQEIGGVIWRASSNRFEVASAQRKEMGAPLRRARRACYRGGDKREHGEALAEYLLQLGLPVAGVGQSELTARPKGMRQKQVLAWCLRQHTTVSERLKVGDEFRVTQAIGQVRDGVEPGLDRLNERLEQAYQWRVAASL